jgi:hypothetical protein
MKRSVQLFSILVCCLHCACSWQIHDNREALRDGVLRVYVQRDIIEFDPEVDDAHIRQQLLDAARERGKILLESLVNHYADLPETRIALLREIPALLKHKGTLVRYHEDDTSVYAYHDFEIGDFSTRLIQSSVELGAADDDRRARKIRDGFDYEQPW